MLCFSSDYPTYCLEIGRPIDAPWIKSLSLRTRKEFVFSPITNEMASMKFDFPEVEDDAVYDIIE